MGRQKLKKVLTEIPESLDAIKQRQSAITELSAKLKMRQRLAAEGFVSKSVKETEPFVDWVYERMPFFQKKEVVIAFRVLPVLNGGRLLFGVCCALYKYIYSGCPPCI
jgi:hypothetical protein